MTEHIVCLNGEISVLIQQGEDVQLLPGQCVLIQSGVTHQVANLSDDVVRYLLTQSGGAYDFCHVPT
jgi:uncharacterized cupin superfamily protein